ncbi:methyl-accepting chemotaxis protein, partial [uncultured Helicobacter sp.]
GESIREQTTGVTQINEAITRLGEITQHNVETLRKTQEVSIGIEQIAGDILQDANKKHFDT